EEREDGGRAGRPVRKVLICHASVGSGHSRAAQALASSLHRLDPSVEVKLVDLMEPPYADRTLIYFYKDWYLRLVGGETVCGNLGGHFVGFLFDRANNVHDSFTGGNALQRRLTQSFLLNFLQLVCEMKPDILVRPATLCQVRRVTMKLVVVLSLVFRSKQPRVGTWVSCQIQETLEQRSISLPWMQVHTHFLAPELVASLRRR
ncbi:unnamed protein product, partial [Effrenium voratum]